MTCGSHSLDTTPPVFNQPQFLKYPTEDAVAEFRNALLDVFDGQSEGEQAGVLYFKPVVK